VVPPHRITFDRLTLCAVRYRMTVMVARVGLVRVSLLGLAALSGPEVGCHRTTADEAAEHAAEAGHHAARPVASAGPTPADHRPSAIDAAPGVRSGSDTSSEPEKVDVQDQAMGTTVHVVAYTNARTDVAKVSSAIARALDEMKRLEGLLSEWRDDSEVGQLNRKPRQWVSVGPETFAVIARGLEEGKASQGAFDITFQVMSDIWKFGSAAEAAPTVPSKAAIERRIRHVDYRKVELDERARAVRIPQGHQLGLGGIAKGYIVDRGADILRQAGIDAFLVQAGGDLYGAGRKPDGSPWVSGIRDPRGGASDFFATIELSDHAFSTAGDYARSYVIGKRRYHHIIDPRTGYPATASRSVTVWADDATTADAIDDAVFILGPRAGLALVEASPGAGAVIVDEHNQVWISSRLQGKVQVKRQPTDGI
jgi:FAD:protein FMN transferase